VLIERLAGLVPFYPGSLQTAQPPSTAANPFKPINSFKTSSLILSFTNIFARHLSHETTPNK
jgi:hypothetical protein